MLVLCVIGTCTGGLLLGWVWRRIEIIFFSGEVTALGMVGDHLGYGDSFSKRMVGYFPKNVNILGLVDDHPGDGG